MGQAHLAISREAIGEYCRRNGIRKLALFGSVLGDDFRSDSDVDVLVEFKHGERAGYLAMARISRELSALFGGRSVDLRTPAELSRYFRDDVIRCAEVYYGE